MAEDLLQKREAMICSYFQLGDSSDHNLRWNDKDLNRINNLLFEGSFFVS